MKEGAIEGVHEILTQRVESEGVFSSWKVPSRVDSSKVSM